MVAVPEGAPAPERGDSATGWRAIPTSTISTPGGNTSAATCRAEGSVPAFDTTKVTAAWSPAVAVTALAVNLGALSTAPRGAGGDVEVVAVPELVDAEVVDMVALDGAAVGAVLNAVLSAVVTSAVDGVAVAGMWGELGEVGTPGLLVVFASGAP